MNATTHAEMVRLAQEASPSIASQRRKARQCAHDEARRLVRGSQIVEPHELLAMLQNIQSAIKTPMLDSCLVEYSEKLTEMCSDLETDLNQVAEPELSGIKNRIAERAQFDALTQRSNRA